MDILILALIVVLVAALVIYLIDLVPAPHPFGLIAKVIVVLIAVIVILQRAGLV